MRSNNLLKAIVAGVFAVSTMTAFAADKNGCGSLPNQAQLKAALIQAVADESSGLNLQMWGTIVDRDGVVCAVAFSGANRGSQWPGSRVISAQKANTANAFSLDGLALSTANLYGPAQGTSGASPIGGSLYGLQFSNPVDTEAAYGGNPAAAGTTQDGMVGKRVGGVNVFGGGLALYNTNNKVVGAVGVSGDTSCADHMIGWRVRNYLRLDNFGATVGGVAKIFAGDAAHPDNVIYDLAADPNNPNDTRPPADPKKPGTNGITDGFEQPTCLGTADQSTLPPVR
jgi:uncharacterized protein GlcG (DUF336 family)